MRVATPLIALYAEQGPNLGLKETLPDKKTYQFSYSLQDLQMPPAQTSPGHTVRIDTSVAATLFCCPYVLIPTGLGSLRDLGAYHKNIECLCLCLVV